MPTKVCYEVKLQDVKDWQISILNDFKVKLWVIAAVSDKEVKYLVVCSKDCEYLNYYITFFYRQMETLKVLPL